MSLRRMAFATKTVGSLTVLFSLAQAPAQTFTTLHSFNGSDGFQPLAGLAVSNNTLYGTADGGGDMGLGVVFNLNADGTAFSDLHSFAYIPDGGMPYAGLVLSGNTLYGTAPIGGGANNGVVFKVNTDGTGFTVLHTFTGFTGYSDSGFGVNGDGAIPIGSLVLSGDTLYGTAAEGGSGGNGTVFSVNIDGTGFTTLHSFTATAAPAGQGGVNSDGAFPTAGLCLAGEVLYGTASWGGAAGCGTVFKVNADGSGFTTLHSFSALSWNGSANANSDGAEPQAGLVVLQDTLYGTAFYGGSSGVGTVFKVNTDGTAFTTLHHFTGGTDGMLPVAGLTVSGHSLFGAAMYGGGGALGTLFQLNADGTGFTTLYNFAGGSDGAAPSASLVLSGNTLYGTASRGGDANGGTVFAMTVPLVVNSPPTVSCPAVATVECSHTATVTVGVTDPDGDALTVVWTVNGQAVQTNVVPSSPPPLTANLALVTVLPQGTNLVTVSVTDVAGNTAACSTAAVVVDTTPPVIASASADQTLIWPPDGRMVTVRLSAVVTDACNPTTWKVIGVSCNEPVNGPDSGSPNPDWIITGADTVQLRAARSGQGTGRVYSVLLQGTDAAGNRSDTKAVAVVVPKSNSPGSDKPAKPSH